jgi:serine/threonine protein kinase
VAVGRQFGPYTLLRKLARGGMADIFLAQRRTEQGEELCVIKMLLPTSVRNPRAWKLFLGEAHLAALLDHPNIVRIYDLDRVDNYYFISMEYVAGETLFGMLHQAAKNHRPLRPYEVAAIMRHTCTGLAYAHGMTDPAGKPLNLVHRDISPSNIMLSYDGQVKILDFGIAAAATRTAGFREGKALGKHAYMSPEQCQGADLDRRSDIFSLGIVFWELITGAALYPGRDPRSVMRTILSGEVHPPSLVNPDIPLALEQVILRALTLEPKDRYQTAHEMGEAIDEAAQGRLAPEAELGGLLSELFGKRQGRLSKKGEVGDEVDLETLLFDDLEAQPPERTDETRIKKWWKPSPGMTALLVVILVLLAGAVGFWIATRPTNPGAQNANPGGQGILLGTIQVDSSPRGARIILNGDDTGKQTPAVLSDVPVGNELKVELKRKGYEPWSGRVLLESQEPRRINAVLTSKRRR